MISVKPAEAGFFDEHQDECLNNVFTVLLLLSGVKNVRIYAVWSEKTRRQEYPVRTDFRCAEWQNPRGGMT